MNKIIISKNGLDQSNIQTINTYCKSYKGKNEGFTLEIKPVRDLRSLQQNKLWWVLCEAVARKTGEYKEICSDMIKKDYMKAKNIKAWVETSKLDINEMNSLLTHAFDYLLSEQVDGYLNIDEGNQWIQYKKSMGEML